MTTYKRKIYLNCDEYICKFNLQVRDITRFTAIYNFRDYHSRIIDESPDSLLTERHIIQLIERPPKQVSEIENRTKIPAGTKKQVWIASESFETWGKTVFEILLEGKTPFDNILSIQCHNCCDVGHAAWGCAQPSDKNHTYFKNYLKQNPDKKTHENRRKQQNRRKNKRAKAEAEKKINMK